MLELKPEDRIDTAPRLFAVTPETEALARSGTGAGTGAPAMQAGPSRRLSMLPLFAAAFPVRFGGAQAAFECPKQIADTQRLIDQVADKLGRQDYRMHAEASNLVTDLLDDARMLLAAARDNHERARSPYDHSRACAKADAALGHARAAEIIQSRCSQR